MRDNDNAGYYISRAEQEDEAAAATSNALAAQIHGSLAERYRAKAVECEFNQPLRLVCN